MKFSVLISIYINEQADYLERCFESLECQTLQADEIVLVEDGPLTDDLYSVIFNWELRLPLKRVKLPQNVGLGMALAEGLLMCSHEVVARMDTDDICMADRFEKQISFLKARPEVDIVGSGISEFEEGEHEIYACRILPQNHEDILRYAQQRNPFNHMTVIFRKAAVNKAGSYLPCKNFEDYFLWCRLLLLGAITANLSEPLVKARAGKDMLKRRHGWKYAILETRFWYEVKKIGFISFPKFIQNIITRCPLRLIPYFLLKRVYNTILRGSGN